MTLAPILLFVYNRPAHTRECLQTLLQNAEAAHSHLFVYADGAASSTDAEAVAETREVVRQTSGFGQLTLVERTRNWGLAQNVIDGVTTLVERYGRVIVLEDDLVVSPYFLRFMNQALDCYADEPRVGHIQACDFTGDSRLPDTYLIRWTGSWGWATWRRAWKLFNPDGRALLAQLEAKKWTREFDFGGAYPYTRMLRQQIAGLNHSWAIRWNASLFLAEVLSVNVGRSLVRNRGFDGSGTHCGNDGLYDAGLYPLPLEVKKIFPTVENKGARAVLADYYRRTNSFTAKAKRRLKVIFAQWLRQS